MDLTLLIFFLVYVVMAVGKLPGFMVDRTGAAVIGALAMMAVGSITAKGAWDAIDYRSMGLMFGLMVVSAAFVVSGFYGWTARRIATLPLSAPALLAVLIFVGAVLSSVLTNDVVVVAMTPLLVSATLARGLNPVPFLLAFCFAANIGASSTLIGSPRNMILAQELGLSFNGFLKVTALPVLICLPLVWGVIALLYRRRWALAAPAGGPAPAHPAAAQTPALDVWETVKAGLVTIAVVVAFVASDWPRDIIALTAAGVLLINRTISSRDMLGHVDGNLLLFIMGLFVVNAAMAATGLPQTLLSDLRGAGIDLADPLALYLVGGGLSNIVGNSPAVMLLVPFLSLGGSSDALGAALGLGIGLSSNLIVFGSLAGIIVVEQAAACGVKISFSEFSRAGVPVTVASMILAAGWILLMAY
ncbi:MULTISPECIES: ArsB/NhaD family transporter [unclassified Xanthobacter]|uniref:SLC13 family permease n=1 Tax=unclassified Xanthobacter TaxID=2623496 RepID=UPI001EDF42CB|nr:MULTISPECIES: SLC13 family permease [unclassified Xanthobacter]